MLEKRNGHVECREEAGLAFLRVGLEEGGQVFKKRQNDIFVILQIEEKLIWNGQERVIDIRNYDHLRLFEVRFDVVQMDSAVKGQEPNLRRWNK